MESQRLGRAPLRWCLFATPDNIYRGARVRLEAVLADEDTLRPGGYPARVEVLGPDGREVFARAFEVRIAESTTDRERPLAVPVFDEEVTVDGPAGAYRYAVTMTGRPKIPGGALTIHVDDPATMPSMPAQVVLCGESPTVREWLTKQKTGILAWDSPAPQRQTIVVGSKLPAPDARKTFAELARRIVRGHCAIFLDPAAFGKDEIGKDGERLRRGRWLSLAGCHIASAGAYGLGDRWARRHPLLEGLPAGGMLDDLFYTDLLDTTGFMPGTYPSKGCPATKQPEVVCGGTYLGRGYGGTISYLAVFEMGAGRFVLNSFLIEANLGRHPAAERLLRNMLNYAARDIGKPLVGLPANFGETLKAMGYE